DGRAGGAAGGGSSQAHGAAEAGAVEAGGGGRGGPGAGGVRRGKVRPRTSCGELGEPPRAALLPRPPTRRSVPALRRDGNSRVLRRGIGRGSRFAGGLVLHPSSAGHPRRAEI